jgi:uncharacterized membrane protein YphA (DoxX/SURF4 family)
MLRITAVLLIVLRLAIGWHFLFEGLQKLHSLGLGPTAYSKPFSSAGYFREATGPLGPLARWTIGDPDTRALGLLVVQPLPEGEDPAADKPQKRMPPLLARDWHDYVDRFVAHYGLDERQRKEAETKLRQAEAKVVLWLTDTRITDKTREVTRDYPTGEVKRKMAPAERIAEYRLKVADLRDAAERNWAFGQDVEKAHLRQLKAEAASLRSDLLKDLDEQTQALQKSLESVLTADQKERTPLPPASEGKLLGWVDWLTAWGLTVIGGCLLIGLLTRLNCLLAAGFLLTTYLLSPPFPWLPVPPMNEGNYVFVNKNLIELLALLVLATTASGRWFGVDALIWGTWRLLRGRR